LEEANPKAERNSLQRSVREVRQIYRSPQVKDDSLVKTKDSQSFGKKAVTHMNSFFPPFQKGGTNHIPEKVISRPYIFDISTLPIEPVNDLFEKSERVKNHVV